MTGLELARSRHAVGTQWQRIIEACPSGKARRTLDVRTPIDGDYVTVLIRDYASADHDGVNRVALAAFAQYEAHYDDWVAFSAGIGRMADLAAPANGADLFVAERDGVIVGAIAHVGPGAPRSPIYPDDWSVIRMLVVDPAQRGRGTARRLVAASLARAYAGGAPVLGLHTSPIMAHALTLYRGIGFERDCELAPIRGVPYARYVLPRAAIPAALERLNSTAGVARRVV